MKRESKYIAATLLAINVASIWSTAGFDTAIIVAITALMTFILCEEAYKAERKC